MSRELRWRVGVTLVLLTLVQALGVIPLPGVDPGFGLGSGTTPWFGFAIPLRFSVGGTGILPYIAGSAVAVTIAALFRGADRFRAGTLERLAIVCALLIAFLQGMGHEIALRIPGMPASSEGAPAFAIPLTQMAGTLLMIGAARAISSRGIGNGVCLLWAVETLRVELRTVLAPSDSAPRSVLWLALGIVLCTFAWLAVALLQARWQIGVWPRVTPEPIPRGLDLSVSGVGIRGMALATSLFGVTRAALAALSGGSASPLLPFLDGPGLAGSLTFVLVAFGCTALFTAWAFDPREVIRLLGATGATLDENAFDRRVERVMLPALLALSLVVVAFNRVAIPLGAMGVRALLLLPLIAIVLDTAGQWRTHVAMAAAREDAEGDGRCGGCGARVREGGAGCGACGGLFADHVPCVGHPDDEAVALCVVCGRTMCGLCARTSDGRSVCEAHAAVGFVQGWAMAAAPATGIEAQLVSARLEREGLRSVTLANTTSPLFATFGMFDAVPLVPLVPHSGLSGGGFRLLVPPGEWEAATRLLDGWPDPALAIPVTTPGASETAGPRLGD